MKDNSIVDANNINADTFRHTYNTQRETENAIFTSERIDKSNYLANAFKDLTINEAKYY